MFRLSRSDILLKEEELNFQCCFPLSCVCNFRLIGVCSSRKLATGVGDF